MRRLSPVLVYSLLAVALTWPAVVHPVRAVPGAARTDLWDSLWSFWYVQQRFAEGSLPLRVDGLLNHPDGGTLWVADPVNALLALPFVAVVGPAAAWSALVVIHVAFAGLAAHALAERLGNSGWAAGLSYASAPFALAHIHNGASEAVSTGWLPLAALAMVEARAAPGTRRILVAAAAVAVTAVAHWYAGVCAFLLLAAFVAFGPARRRLLAVGLAAALLAAPAAAIARSAATTGDNVVGIKTDREVATVRRTIGPADPVAFFAPGDYRSPDFRELSRYGEEYIHTPYLGWGLILVASLSLRKRAGTAPWWLAGVAAAVLACGPVLAQGGGPVILTGRLAVPLPYLLLERVPLFSSLSLLWRLSQLSALALSVLAARGAGRFGALAGALAVAEAAFVSPMRSGPGHTDASLPPAIVALADEPEGALMNFPVAGARAYLYEQTAHRKPITGGLNFPNNNASRRVWKAMMEAAGDDPSELRRAVVEVARKEGVRYLVVHIDPMARPDMHDAAVLAWKAAMKPISDTGALRVYRLW